MPDTDIGYLINSAARRFWLELARALAGTGLTPPQAAVIMAIGRSGEARLTPGAISEAIDTDAATTTGLLDRLERDGWLLSARNPGDGRSRLIGLSAKAEEAYPAVVAAADGASVAATACLSADELGTLRELLLRLCQAGRDAGSR